MNNLKAEKHSKKIDLGHSEILWRDDGIMQVKFGDKTDIDLKEAQEIFKAQNKLSNNTKVLILNIAGKNTSATIAARDFAASAEATIYTLAEAFVVNNLAQKIIGNFYVNFHKPKVPTKIFNNVDEALLWLKSLKF